MKVRLMVCALMLVGFGVASRGDDKSAKPAKPAPANASFERIKKMAGTWVEADKDGKATDKVVSVVKLTAGGSTVQETLFPGTPMEMMSVYHMDKGDLVMTHYCMLGNQPRMKADAKAPANQIKWVFTGGTNLDPAKDMHMHEGTVTFIDDDHVEVSGVAWVDGEPAPDHCVTMKLVRKK